MIKKASIFFLIAVFTVCVASAQDVCKTPEQLIQEAKAVIKEVSIQDVKQMIDSKEKVIILDIRDKEEYDQGHLPGAINMSLGKLPFHIHELIPDKNAKVVVY
jgi:adenylyltransferase/sulfurtransferase